MKVILLQDVARIGKKNDVKEVPDGHARNFLLPRKMAVLASPENLKKVHALKSKKDEDAKHASENFAAALAKLKDVTVQYPAEVNEQGHLFKGIKADDIAKHLQAEGYAVSAEHVSLVAPLKEAGLHTIELVQGGAKGELTLEIVKK